MITFLLNLLVFLVLLTFFPKTSELFEFNKMVLVYIFTILIAAAWALECIRQKKLIFRSTPLDLPIGIFLLSQLLSTLTSIDTRTSFLGYYGRFNGGLISYLSYAFLYWAYVTFMNRVKTIKLIKVVLISAGIAALYGVFEHMGVSPSCVIIRGTFDISCWSQDVAARVFGTFGQPNWLAAALVSLTPLAWSQALRKKSSTFILLSALMFTTILFTKSRSGLLGFVFAFIVFWLPNIKKHFSIFLLTTTYSLLAMAFVWNPFMYSSEPPVEGVTESGDIRKIVWQGAIDLWKKYPILGTGVETFAYSYYETRPAEHNLTSEWNFIYNKAHNEYLNFAATTGTVGLASYLLLIFSSIKTFFRKINIVKSALLAGYISILVTNFFGFSTVTTTLLFFLFPAMAKSLDWKSGEGGEFKFKHFNYKQKFMLIILSSSTLLLFYFVSRYWLSDYYYAQGDALKAVSLSPYEPLYRIELAKVYTTLGNANAAERELVLAEQTTQRNIKLLKSAAGVYDDLGETNKKYLEKSLEVYKRVTALAPTDAHGWYQLALAYAKLGELTEAKEVLSKVLEMKPDYELARKLKEYLE
jgi:O-antigen ligase